MLTFLSLSQYYVCWVILLSLHRSRLWTMKNIPNTPSNASVLHPRVISENIQIFQWVSLLDFKVILNHISSDYNPMKISKFNLSLNSSPSNTNGVYFFSLIVIYRIILGVYRQTTKTGLSNSRFNFFVKVTE